MRFLSLFSGIEAASVAWEPLGFKAVGFSGVDPFCCSLLAQRFPGVKNFGDVTKFEEWDLGEETVDVAVGGSPCQDLSQGGKMQGWQASRSGLAWSFLGIAKRFRPRWVVWENVQGAVRGKNKPGFIEFAKGFDELGYCFSWRILDSRYFGVPQRRPRVFAVASLGTDCSRKVLLESEGIVGVDSSPSLAEVSVCLTARGAGSLDDRETYVRDERGIRRMMPIEHERLMGFPDNWTLVTYRNKPAADRPRYRSIGNSFAVPVVRWIGKRIQQVESGSV